MRSNQLDKRAQSLAAMGLVTREGSRYHVKTAAAHGRQESYEVWRDENGRIRCSCPEFERLSADPAFRCEHILAIKYSLATNREEQEMNSQLDGNEITQPAQTDISPDQAEPAQPAPIVPLAFANMLRTLRQPIDPRLIKTREGWTDRQGQTHMVEYIEWHTVADILDRIAPDWSHAVRNITQVGDLVAVTAAITIDGITREGIGTGPAETETGIKKAEHDALKRAAVKFGIARDLYRRESDVIEQDGIAPSVLRDPRPKTLGDLVTPKQLWMIRNLGREIGCDAEQECQSLLQCNLEEISKRAASSLIDYLKRRQQENQPEELRRAS
ncbi:MAG TPA: Rad52/Rad22 family DNA repair protein [Blastocatellia bacterium]|nr:Rad52/Rad22 family DNA repair protein [Blastocatellia bacterium]